MLKELQIRDMLIIDRLELDFQPGLNVLTGETGAGKSILLDSLGFVLGWRGRAELVRAGAERGEVEAVFELHSNHPAKSILEESGLPVEDDLILRRINTKDGRKTAWVNDRRVSGEVLRALSDTLIELHGQHDDRGLLDAKGHRALLDAFGETGEIVAKVRGAWHGVSHARKALEAAQSALTEAKAEEEFLRHAVSEFDSLSPEIGEEDTLDTDRRLMQSAEKIREDILKAQQALGSDGAEGAAGNALRWLEGASDKAEGRLEGAIAALSRALVELGEAEAEVTTCLEALQFDPYQLEHIEERLFAIRALARKHNVSSDELPALADTMRQRLTGIDQGDAHLNALEHALNEAQAIYNKHAEDLTQARHEASKRLDSAMMSELAPLKMERAVFETHVTEGGDGPDGRDEVTFLVATNPGAPAGPLGKIASGGELSRFLLALKVCLSGEESSHTMIFDEIDRGVGGATADAVGRRLAQLAQDGQVLVVTHSPQVAALGAHHWRVQKSVENDQTLSTVVSLSPMDRVQEIARMLSGDTITPQAEEAAKALLHT